MTVWRNGRECVGFGDEQVRAPPPLELRTAYTVKGLGIGAGGLIGFLLGGPLGMILGGGAGWYAGNHAAVYAEKKFVKGAQ